MLLPFLLAVLWPELLLVILFLLCLKLLLLPYFSGWNNLSHFCDSKFSKRSNHSHNMAAARKEDDHGHLQRMTGTNRCAVLDWLKQSKLRLTCRGCAVTKLFSPVQELCHKIYWLNLVATQTNFSLPPFPPQIFVIPKFQKMSSVILCLSKHTFSFTPSLTSDRATHCKSKRTRSQSFLLSKFWTVLEFGGKKKLFLYLFPSVRLLLSFSFD